MDELGFKFKLREIWNVTFPPLDLGNYPNCSTPEWKEILGGFPWASVHQDCLGHEITLIMLYWHALSCHKGAREDELLVISQGRVL